MDKQDCLHPNWNHLYAFLWECVECGLRREFPPRRSPRDIERSFTSPSGDIAIVSGNGGVRFIGVDNQR